MEKKRLRTHFLTLAISCFLFFMGVFIGSFITRTITVDYTKKMIDLETDIIDMQLLSLTTEKSTKFTCSLLENTLDYTNEKLKSIGDEILKYESEEKVLKGEYDIVKKRLMLTRIRVWLLTNRLKTSCNSSYTSVLYFYSTDGSCDRCQQQGVITSFISQKSDGLVQVSAIDVNEDLAIVKALKSTYNVTSTPTLIFNGVDVHRGFMDKNEMIEIICEYNRLPNIC